MTAATPRIEITVSAPVEQVWNALRDKDKVRHWHGWDLDGPDGLDREIDLIYFTHVTEDEQARTLDVQGGDLFRLEPHGAGTRIVLTRAPRGGDPEWDAYYDDVTEGWITFLHQLKFAVERQPGNPRRTLFFAGSSAGSAPVVDELGLAEVAALPPGSPFQTTLLGEEIKGEVWFRSDHQLGITVDTWGNGLLVVSSVAPTDTRPAGSVMAVLSTYGLGDTALDSLSRRWAPWWTEHHPAE